MAKKMILVDPLQWEAKHRVSHPIPDGLSTSLTNLDQDMNAILHDDNKDVYTKAKIYQQTLNRYLTLADKYRDKPIGKIEMMKQKETDPLIKDTVDTERDLKSKILDSIPTKLQPKASLLIEHLKENPEIKWDQKLQLVVGDKTITGSNAVDLINDLVRNRKKTPSPHGWEHLAAALKKTNTPKEFIGNPLRLQWLERGRSVTRSPRRSIKKTSGRDAIKWSNFPY